MKNTEVATVEDFAATLDVIMQQALNDSTLSSKDTLKKPVHGVYFQRRDSLPRCHGIYRRVVPCENHRERSHGRIQWTGVKVSQ
jgi:hypothetical protein